MNEMEKEIVEVSLDSIIPNRFQPRLSFDEQGLNELAKSIRQHGIIQPLVLRKIGNKYEIIAGERRYKASYIAGLTKVPAVIINLNDNESAEVAIVENLQREDLSPIEEARSYKKLLDRGYLTQDELASRMGKTQATISNKLRLLNLDEKVQDALLDNKISERHARSLLKLTNKEDQVEMLDEIINKRMNVRLTEDAINNKLNGNIAPLETNNLKEPEIPKINIITNNQDNSNDVDFNEKIPRIDGNGELNVVSKDKFTNPTLDSINKDETPNPIPFIRPVLDDQSSSEDLIKPLPKQNTDIKFTVEGSMKKDMQEVENKIKAVVDSIKELGFNIRLEQYDFDSLYQFVLKVDKK